MSYDLVVRGGTVVDGSGSAGRRADVAVIGDRIVAIEPSIAPDSSSAVVDASDLVVAPGFIDIHTHYDAQILWDPDLEPTSWHGVTTAIMGNCGFGIAPTRPEHRGLIPRTLEHVEGMSYEALEEGISWGFETFPEYLKYVDKLAKRINVAALVGHTATRFYVMGDAATERHATDDEIKAMQRIVAEAVACGAIGFATSTHDGHVGEGGRPVPSRVAAAEEFLALVEPLAQLQRGTVQISSGGIFESPEELMQLAQRAQRPLTWSAMLTGYTPEPMKMLDETQDLGGDVWPQVTCREMVQQMNLMDPPPHLESLPAFTALLELPRERRPELYRDAAWVSRSRADVNARWGHRWIDTYLQETDVHSDLIGANIAELAQARGMDPWDLAVELSLAEGLKTRFKVVLANDDEEELGRLLQDPRTVLGLSDAGAHASTMCDACFSSYLLGHWVRERGVLSLEQAVWRMTSQPARLYGLTGRGRLRPGNFADITIFDPDRVGVASMKRVADLPAGADRLVAESEGIVHVIVNGALARTDEQPVQGVRNGRLIQS